MSGPALPSVSLAPVAPLPVNPSQRSSRPPWADFASPRRYASVHSRRRRISTWRTTLARISSIAARGLAATAAAASASAGRFSTASVSHIVPMSAVTRADASASICFRCASVNVRLPRLNSTPYRARNRSRAFASTHLGSGGSTIAR